MQWEEVKSESFIGLVQKNHLLLKQLIQTLGFLERLLHNGKLQKYGDQNSYIFPIWFTSIHKFGPPRLSVEAFWTKTKDGLFWAISVSSKRDIKSNNLKLVLSMQKCQRSLMTQYASRNTLGTKQYLTYFVPG